MGISLCKGVRSLFLAIIWLVLLHPGILADAADRASEGGRVVRTSDDPPFLVTQPQSAAGLEGDSITLSVAAGGTAPLQYQWFKDGQPVPGATTPIFEIPFLLEADAGTYRVEVSNAFGKVVSADASISFLPLIQVFVEGNLASGIVRVSKPVLVSLKSARPGWILHYTTDGSEPVPTSPTYTAPFLVSEALELRVAADAPDHLEFLEGDSVRFLFLAPQVIDWEDLPSLRYPESGTVGATSSSGLPVRIRVLSGPAVLEGSVLRTTGVGLVVLRAEQDGNETFAAAASEQSLEIGRGVQGVTFQPIPDRLLDDPPVQLVATTTTGLPVTFQVVSGPAVLSGNLLTPTGVGRIEVKALQGGSDLWLPADAIQSFIATRTMTAATLSIEGPRPDGSYRLDLRAPAEMRGTVEFSPDLRTWTPVGKATGQGPLQPVPVVVQPGSTSGGSGGFWRFQEDAPGPQGPGLTVSSPGPGGKVTVRATGPVDSLITVEFSLDLVTWLEVATVVGAGPSTPVTVPTGLGPDTGLPRGFWRARVP